MSITFLRGQHNRHKTIYYNSNYELAKRLVIINGTINNGNDSPGLIEERRQLLKLLQNYSLSSITQEICDDDLLPNGLSDRGLVAFAISLDLFPGFRIYWADTLLPAKLDNKKTQCLIIKQGMHWVSLYCGQDQEHVVYFDPFGMPPSRNTMRLLNSLKDKEPVSISMQVQHQSTHNCGLWCLYILYLLKKRVPLIQILSQLSSHDQKKNEKLLTEFIIDVIRVTDDETYIRQQLEILKQVDV